MALGGCGGTRWLGLAGDRGSESIVVLPSVCLLSENF